MQHMNDVTRFGVGCDILIRSGDICDRSQVVWNRAEFCICFLPLALGKTCLTTRIN